MLHDVPSARERGPLAAAPGTGRARHLWPVNPRQPQDGELTSDVVTRTRRVLLLEDVHADAAVHLRKAGFDVDHRTTAMSEDELVESVRDIELLGIRSATRVTRRVISAATHLKAIGAFCIGTNQIDIPAANERGIAVFNAPYSNTRSVVELAIAEIISLTRRLPERNAALHAGVWQKTAAGANEVRGRCLGIIGYGSIGSQLSVIAEALGMTVVFYDVADRLPLGTARRCASMQELLQLADAVTLHVDGRVENAGLIADAELALMKPGSILLNLSRGSVVDLAALHRHLDTGHLAGAAIDVFPDEPKRSGAGFHHELQGRSNVILTPHIGGSTQEAQQNIAAVVAEKLRGYAVDAATASCVNVPVAVAAGVSTHPAAARPNAGH